jgi:hypothetical protein
MSAACAIAIEMCQSDRGSCDSDQQAEDDGGRLHGAYGLDVGGAAAVLAFEVAGVSYFGGSTLIVAVGPTPAVRIHIGSFPDPS